MDAAPSWGPDPDRSASLPPDASGAVEPECTVRLADAGDLAAALPHLVGFPPRESVVLVGLGRPSGSRVGLTVRVDIPSPGSAAHVARSLAAGLDTDGPDAAVLAIVSEAADVPALPRIDAGVRDEPHRSLDLPHRHLARHLVVALAAYGIPLREQLLVRAGRWWSYDCPGDCCAPGAGSAIPTGVTPLAAASAAAGRVLAGSRGELRQRIARSVGEEAAAMRAASLRIGEQAADLVLAEGHAAAADRYWQWITAAVAGCAAGPGARQPTDDDVARVAWALRDRLVRDRALGLCLGADADAAERLWTECTRRAVSPLDAAPATLLAVTVWLCGDGAMARIALDRALDSDPRYALAALLSRALDSCLPPRDLRAMVAGTLADLGGNPSAAVADGGPVVRAGRGAASPRPGRARPGRRSRSRTRRPRSQE